ncbi:hypothetical protein QTP86_033451, partial [Hemibagrus guttatus]
MPHQEDALGKTQDTLESLCLLAGLGTPRGPSGRAGGSVWGEGGNPNTCESTTSSVLSTYFKGNRVALLPGSPCYKNQGYCDHLQTCRLLDADGPIARLKNSYLKLSEYDDLADWMK